MSNIEDPCVVLVHASRSSVALRLHVRAWPGLVGLE